MTSEFNHYKSKKKKLVFETGAGFSVRNIHTFLTAGVNTPDKSITPFNKTLPSVNGSVGLAWNPNNNWNLKTNIGTGFRPVTWLNYHQMVCTKEPCVMRSAIRI